MMIRCSYIGIVACVLPACGVGSPTSVSDPTARKTNEAADTKAQVDAAEIPSEESLITNALIALYEARDDPVYEVAEAATKSILAIDPEANVKPVRPEDYETYSECKVEDEDEVVIESSMEIDSEEVASLVESLEVVSEEERWRIYLTLKAAGPKASNAIPSLVAFLLGEDPTVVAAAIPLAEKGTKWGKAGVWFLEEEARILDVLVAIGPASVPALVSMLSHIDKGVVRHAAWALGEIGPDDHDAVSALVESLKHTSWSVRSACAEALGKIGSSNKSVVKALFTALKDENDQVRWHVSEALATLGSGNEAVVKKLIEALEHKKVNVRVGAAQALGSIKPPSLGAVPALIKAVHDSSWEVRVEAIRTLSKIGEGAGDAVLTIVLAVGDENTQVSDIALVCFRDVGTPPIASLPKLENALVNANPKVRWAAALAIGLLGQEASGALDSLLAAADDEEPRVRAGVVEALGNIQDIRAAPVLVKALDDEAFEVRYRAAEALGKLGPAARKHAPVLAKAIEVITEKHQQYYTALIRIDESLAVPLLIDVFQDDQSSEKERCASATALGYTTSQVEIVLPVLESGATGVIAGCTLESVVALGDIGPPAKATVLSLVFALRDSEWSIRQAAAEALGKILGDIDTD